MEGKRRVLCERPKRIEIVMYEWAEWLFVYREHNCLSFLGVWYDSDCQQTEYLTTKEHMGGAVQRLLALEVELVPPE